MGTWASRSTLRTRLFEKAPLHIVLWYVLIACFAVRYRKHATAQALLFTVALGLTEFAVASLSDADLSDLVTLQEAP